MTSSHHENDGTHEGQARRPEGTAFLLSQLGSHSGRRFAERIADLDLTPPQAGLLRAIAMAPGQNQHALAGRIGTPPSRLVALVDDLEERGVVQRRPNPNDRRHHALHLTAAGERLMGKLAEVGIAHEDDLFAGLNQTERACLHELLRRVAEQLGLSMGIGGGFR